MTQQSTTPYEPRESGLPESPNVRQALQELLQAAELAYKILDTITAKDFELGKDKPAREALQRAIQNTKRLA